MKSDFPGEAGVSVGQVLDGKYRVERLLAVGGMGVVVAAQHIQLDEKVALKFLRPEALSNPEAVTRFAREARAAVRIKGEHVARVTDVGALPNGAPYMVMEYLDGVDLGAWVERGGALPIEQAVEFVIQACVGVADAHAIGIVHRDLKPANLFCVRRSDGQLIVKVLDFGISKIIDANPVGLPAVTQTSAVMGSPQYMSPEQIRSSRDVDAQSDIWGLGVILFELVGGRAAFVADSMTDLVVKIVTEPTPSVRSLRPDVPPALEAVVFRCLQKERSQRYRNVEELAQALLPFASRRARALVERISGIMHAAGLSTSASPLPPSSAGTEPTGHAGTLLPFQQTAEGARAGKTALMGLLGVSLAALLVGAVGSLVWFKRGTSVPTPAPARAVGTSPPVELSAVAPFASLILPDPMALPDSGEAQHPVPEHRTPSSPPPATLATVTRNTASSPPPPASAPPPKPNCNPSFYLDDQGEKHFKPECFVTHEK